MTIVVTPVKTYAQMLATLRERCGLHGTIGNAPALADILTEAHEYVYEQLDDGLPITDTITLIPNVATYPWIADVDSVPIARGSVQEVWIAQGSTERLPLLQGINHAQRAYADMRSIPERYDSKFVDYYYGVKASEAVVGRSTYQGKSSNGVEAGLRIDYSPARQHNLYLDFGITQYGSAIKDSPLVEKANQSTVSLGYLYKF